MKGMKYGTCTQSCGWEDNGRWRIHMLGESNPNEFDTYVSRADQRTLGSDFLPLTEQLCNYQAILNVGSNADWAERLRQCFYGNAVVMVPENPPSEFFNSFMRPWNEYWPIKADLSDVVDQVSKVLSLTDMSRSILLRAQRDFAAVYLSEEFMYYYDKLAIMEYAARVKNFAEKNQDAASDQSGGADEAARSLLKLGGCRRFQKRQCPGDASSRIVENVEDLETEFQEEVQEEEEDEYDH